MKKQWIIYDYTVLKQRYYGSFSSLFSSILGPSLPNKANYARVEVICGKKEEAWRVGPSYLLCIVWKDRNNIAFEGKGL